MGLNNHLFNEWLMGLLRRKLNKGSQLLRTLNNELIQILIAVKILPVLNFILSRILLL